MNDFANRLKRLRENRGWTQTQLADALKVAQPTVSRWETGISTPVGMYAGVYSIVARLERKHQAVSR